MERSPKATYLWCAVLSAAAVLIAITFGLVFGLVYVNQLSTSNTTDTAKPNDTIGRQIIALFSDNVQLPNGSYVTSLSQLTKDDTLPSPIIANSSLLQQFGYVVDPTSNVLVTNRKTFLYVLVPPVQRGVNPVGPSSPIGIGLKFSGSEKFTSASLSFLGTGQEFISIGTTPDGSILCQLPVSAPASMCPTSAQGQCVSLTYQAYLIVNQSVSVPSPPSILSVACGPQCQDQKATCNQSCEVCGSGSASGADTPITRRYHMGRTSGTFVFRYQTNNAADRMRVFQDDQQIFDSGCLGTRVDFYRNITFNGTTDEIRVDVEPNCRGTTGTSWDFTVLCPTPCDSGTQNQALLVNNLNMVSSGGTVYIDQDANMPSLSAYYCTDAGSSSSATVNWTFAVTSSGDNDAPCTGNRTLTSSSPTWEITSDINDQGWVMGGNAQLSWIVNGVNSGSISFKILGKQPDRKAVMDYIKSRASYNPRLWFAPYIAAFESKQGSLLGPTQFCDKTSGYRLCANADGYPMRSFYDGYGVMQLTEPSCNEIWSWKRNCNQGVRVLQRMANNAWDWMNSPAIDPSTNMSSGQRLMAQQQIGRLVPVATDTEANCVFADDTTRVIEDAVAMKMYNGARSNFCEWDSENRAWKFNRFNSLDFNYVLAVCQLVS